MVATISEKVLGSTASEEAVKQFVLRNANGSEAKFINVGAAWVGFQFSDDTPNLVLGCDTLEAYLSQEALLGATVGRFANRINNSQFTLNGELIQVSENMAPHHIHGGFSGFSNKIWNSHIELINEQPTLTFSYRSEDGEEGYPGNLDVKIVISLSNDNKVSFDYLATTDKPTVVNLTNHAYFNLQGAKTGHINDHEFKIHANTFLTSDTLALPTGEITPVDGSALDLRDWSNIAQSLSQLDDENIRRATGYDHCYCPEQDGLLKIIAEARCNGVKLTCASTLPGMQFYTGNFLANTPINDVESYDSHGAFCFEPGYWPDSPNHDHFPTCEFDKSRPYTAIIEYQFTKQ
jgi:aldose 1-epimerase